MYIDCLVHFKFQCPEFTGNYRGKKGMKSIGHINPMPAYVDGYRYKYNIVN